MDTPPPLIEDEDLVGALAGAWRLAVERVRYLPKGLGSYHWLADARDGRRYFLTVDDLDTKPWLGADRETTFAGLKAAYGTALMLHDDGRLGFVVPPVRETGGAAAIRLTPRLSLAVFPFVEGVAGRWGDRISPGERARLLRRLAELHLSTSAAVAARAPRCNLELPGRAALEGALAQLDRPWSGGPFSEPARLELAAHAHAVHGWLASFDDLAARVAKTEPAPVVTHGEPHPGNLIHVDDEVRLVDWDTVAVAPPERDLWMLDDESDAGWAAYSDATGRTVDDTAISLYRLAWTLTDIAAFTVMFRSEHERHTSTRFIKTTLTCSCESHTTEGSTGRHR